MELTLICIEIQKKKIVRWVKIEKKLKIKSEIKIKNINKIHKKKEKKHENEKNSPAVEREEGAKEVEEGGSGRAAKGEIIWIFCGPRDELKKEFEKSFFSFSSVIIKI